MFNIDDFLKICVPSFLKNRKDYYVKGGKAYDIYFKDKTNSIDWDLVGSKSFKDYLEVILKRIEKFFSLKLLIRNTEIKGNKLYQYGFKDHYIENNDPYLIDLILDTKFKIGNFTILNNLNYMKISDFMSDLLVTKSERLLQLRKYENKRNNDNMIKDIKNFIETYNMDMDIDKILSSDLRQVIKYTEPYFKKYIINNSNNVNKVIIYNSIIDPLNKYYKNTKNIDYNELIAIFNTDIEQILEEKYNDNITSSVYENIQEMSEFINNFSSDILSSLNAINNNNIEKKMITRKYNKTLKRYKNIINISWDNISDLYKIYILSTCYKTGSVDKDHHLALYDVSETCKAFALCYKGVDVKITSAC